MNVPPLGGCVTLHSGEQIDFSVPGEQVDAVLKQLHGGRPFARPALVLAGSQSLIACPGSAIVRLDLDEHPAVQASDIEQLPAGYSRREVTADEWRTGTAEMEAQGLSRTERLSTPGATITVYGRFGLTSADTFYHRHELPTPELFEQRRFLANLFTQGSFAFERATGGVSVLNPAHILYAQYHPGAMPTADSWMVSQFQLQ